MKIRKHTTKKAIIVVVLMSMVVASGSTEPLHFLSNQLAPVTEAEIMKHLILTDFPLPVDFQAYDDRELFRRLVVQSDKGSGGYALIGCLYEDFLFLHQADTIEKVDIVLPILSNREFIDTFTKLGKLGQDSQYFIPWMQATYLMAANRQALKYLPKGADLNHLTYKQLTEWAADMYRETGKPKLGFPVGPKGLMHRFIQGFLYPSYTGSMTNKFSGPDAENMWGEFRELWQYVTSRSLIYDRMDTALLAEEVWLAWDHTARLIEAFKQRPDDFVAFPAPKGPMGRGFILVLAGLGFPKGSMHPAAPDLIEYLTRPTVQINTMTNLGFFPVVRFNDSENLPYGLSLLNQAVTHQIESRDGILIFQQQRSKGLGGNFDLVFLTTFSKVILRGEDIPFVLKVQENMLRQVLESE